MRWRRGFNEQAPLYRFLDQQIIVKGSTQYTDDKAQLHPCVGGRFGFFDCLLPLVSDFGHSVLLDDTIAPI